VKWPHLVSLSAIAQRRTASSSTISTRRAAVQLAIYPGVNNRRAGSGGVVLAIAFIGDVQEIDETDAYASSRTGRERGK